MAEVQKTVQSGEMTQRFMEFVIMHAQNAALFLGQIPNPKTGEAEVNLDLARMFIDQLEMIHEIVALAVESLGRARPPGGPEGTEQPETPPPASAATPPDQSAAPEASTPVASGEPETESRKKFTKSYGP